MSPASTTDAPADSGEWPAIRLPDAVGGAARMPRVAERTPAERPEVSGRAEKRLHRRRARRQLVVGLVVLLLAVAVAVAVLGARRGEPGVGHSSPASSSTGGGR